jgi:hypothetical protein
MTDNEFEERIRLLKMLNKNIILALEKAKKDWHYISEYDKAVQEYEDEKNKLYRELQQDRGD